MVLEVSRCLLLSGTAVMLATAMERLPLGIIPSMKTVLTKLILGQKHSSVSAISIQETTVLDGVFSPGVYE